MRAAPIAGTAFSSQLVSGQTWMSDMGALLGLVCVGTTSVSKAGRPPLGGPRRPFCPAGRDSAAGALTLGLINALSSLARCSGFGGRLAGGALSSSRKSHAVVTPWLRSVSSAGRARNPTLFLCLV